MNFGSGDLSFGAPKPEDPADVLVAASGKALPSDDRQWLWFSDHAAAPVPVSPDEAMVLGHCAAFAHLDDHAGRIAGVLGAPPQAVRKVLDPLVRRGVLRSIRQHLPPTAHRSELVPEPVRVIRTCRRPDSLNRLLDDLTREHHTQGGNAPLFVVDDSADPAFEQQTRAAVAAFAKNTGLVATVLDGGARERWFARWRDRLPEVDRSVLDELLSPERAPSPVPGRAFNWAVLLAVGHPLSILDDDFVLPLKRFNGARDELEIRHSTAYVAEFPDPDDATTLTDITAPMYDEARRLLGQSAAAVIGTIPFMADALAGTSPRELDWLDARTRVRAVIQGTYGSFGVASVLGVCGPGKRTLANLLRPPFRFSRLTADPIHYGLDRTRLSAEAVSLPWLIDARTPVPPTNAAGVAEDTLFASLLRQIDPHACFAYVPSLIGHQQVDRRDRIVESLKPISFGANHFLAQQLQSVKLSGRDVASRFASVSHWFADLESGDDADLDQVATRWWNEERANACATLTESLAQNPSAPPEWRDFVTRMRAANQAVVNGLDVATLTTLRRAIRQTRVAMAVWPMVFDEMTACPITERCG